MSRDRVGQAIYEETGLRPWSGVEAWDKLPEERKEPWMRDADRAISAMDNVKFEKLAEILEHRAVYIRRLADQSHEYKIADVLEALASGIRTEIVRL
jgi:hypothetical protein